MLFCWITKCIKAVFAKVAALDVIADSILVIGTNVAPFRDQQRENLRTLLRERLLDVAGHGPDSRQRLAAEIGRRLRRDSLDVDAARARLRDVLGAELTDDEARLWTDGRLDDVAASLVIAPITPDRTIEQARAQWVREVSWLHRLATGADWSADAAIAGLGEILASRVMPLLDPYLTGDQVVHGFVLRHRA